MATATFSMKYSTTSSDLSTVQSAGETIQTLLTGQGWTLTADTGQVTWSSLTYPASSTTLYQIYECGDSLATSQPLYMKLSLILGGSGTQNARWGIQIGLGGTNGSGSFLSPSSSAIDLSGNYGTNDTTLRNCYVSAGPSYFTMMYLCGWNAACMVAVERSLNSSGAYASTYAHVAAVIANSDSTAQAIYPSGGSSPVQQPAFLVSSATTTAFNGSVLWSPLFPGTGNWGNPMTGMSACRSTEQSDQGTNTGTLYGTSHTYIFSSANYPAEILNSNWAIGIRYE